MAQFVMQDLVNKAGLGDVLRVDSAATTNDEIGHPPHHGTVDKLKQVGVPVLPHSALVRSVPMSTTSGTCSCTWMTRTSAT